MFTTPEGGGPTHAIAFADRGQPTAKADRAPIHQFSGNFLEKAKTFMTGRDKFLYSPLPFYNRHILTVLSVAITRGLSFEVGPAIANRTRGTAKVRLHPKVRSILAPIPTFSSVCMARSNLAKLKK